MRVTNPGSITAHDRAHAALDRWLQVTFAGLDASRARRQLLDVLQEIACEEAAKRAEESAA